MTDEQIKALRQAFPPDQVGKLPKPTQKNNEKGRCAECGGWHGLPAIHLDYVGHASVTDRILSVDPDYEFGPVLDINKRPITHEAGGNLSVLHYLTIAGSTKYEWGDGPNMKEVSSDAIRRCAMRFGVALDLWSKEPLAVEDGASELASPPLAARKRPAAKTAKRWRPNPSQQALLDAAKDASVDDALRHRIIAYLTRGAHTSVKTLADDQADKITAQLAYFQTHRAAAMLELEKWEAKTNE